MNYISCVFMCIYVYVCQWVLTAVALIEFFNLNVRYWHDKNYTFVLPKQLQLGCSQIVHIWINTKKKKIIVIKQLFKTY